MKDGKLKNTFLIKHQVIVWLWRKKPIPRAKLLLMYRQEHTVATCEAWDKYFAIARYLLYLERVRYKTNYNVNHVYMQLSV